MTDNDGRGFALSEDRSTYLRLYPVAGTPTEGDGVRVNADLDLEFGEAGGCTPEILVDDVSGEILFDDVTGDVLYDETSCVGGGSGGGATELDDLTDVVLASPAAGDLLQFDGSDWVNVPAAAATHDTADATTYVATTGNDTTGDGTSGNPYATVGKALSTLPRSIGFVQTVDIADGTYAEALVVDDFVCTGAGKILLTGNTTTPANVVFTGTVTRTARAQSDTACAYVAGPVVVEFEGLTLDATAEKGLWAVQAATVELDRCVVDGSTLIAVAIWDHARLTLHGNNTISGWSGTLCRGLQLLSHASATIGTAGTLTITGPGTVDSTGIDIVSADFMVFAQHPSGCHITITEVQTGFYVGFNATFTHHAATATITVDNASTPSNSIGISCSDFGTWSTEQTLVLDHLTTGVYLTAISYCEASGTRTFTNLGTTSSENQNSIFYAP